MVSLSLRISIFVLLLGHLLSNLYAQNEVYLKIKSEGFKPINLFMAPFTSDLPAAAVAQFRQVLINDLAMSGFFRVSDESPNSWLSEPHNSQTEMISVVYLEGQLSDKGNDVVFQMRMVEVPGEKKIFAKTYTSSLPMLRWLAHEVSDEAHFYLVGEYGIATTRIALVTEKGSAKELAIIDYDGYNFKPLTFSNSLNLSPRWSPEGDRIVFTSYVQNNPDLFVLPLSDGKPFKLSGEPGLNTAPAWSPNGQYIAMTMTKDGNPEIYAMELKGRKLRRLTNHPAIDSSPSWSPDSREIVFTSDRSGTPQLYLMDAEGGNVRRLTFEGNYHDSPAWSPRGDRIAFVSRDEKQFHIFTIQANGEQMVRLTDGGGNHENPSWSPDGLRLVFASNREGQWDLYVMNWDGTQLRRLTRDGGNISPSWSPRLKLDK